MDLLVGALDINEGAELSHWLTQVNFFDMIHIKFLSESQADVVAVTEGKGTFTGGFVFLFGH